MKKENQIPYNKEILQRYYGANHYKVDGVMALLLIKQQLMNIMKVTKNQSRRWGSVLGSQDKRCSRFEIKWHQVYAEKHDKNNQRVHHEGDG